ncbi:hypothetical protein L1267_15925 [Pseudoalteromonas sp. OFAV1]|uniref:hypothetical protein n=1 Tax=Pseudoalteromonas sp. OFAV1 TaxID=2908892 RepID=UPI001F1BE4B1|nr:hypothetical protein [Pseudoalteromonas sp. OFAV1]MCF2901865.1 hypothetical protein [Pseudoalteromonas sp. OFAV1]
MSAITADQILQNDTVGQSFDENFVNKIVEGLPSILSMDDEALTFGSISKAVKLPRPEVGKFLIAASEIANWPLGVISRKPYKKDLSKVQAPNSSSNDAQGDTQSKEEVAAKIISILKMPPVDDVIGVNYASIPHLVEETGASTEFVTEVVNYLIDHKIVKQFEGENDFEEEIFTLNHEGLVESISSAKEQVKTSATQNSAVADKQEQVKAPSQQKPMSPREKIISASSETNSRDKGKTRGELSVNRDEINQKTFEAVRRALKADKYTKNGILKKVSKPGTHKRDDVLAAFTYFVEKGIAQLTENGGARKYYKINVTPRGASQEAASNPPVEVTVETVSSAAEKDAKEPVVVAEPVKEKEVSETTAPVEKKVSEPAERSYSAGTEGIKQLLKANFENMVDMIESGAELDELKKNIKSIELMIEAAKVLEN